MKMGVYCCFFKKKKKLNHMQIQPAVESRNRTIWQPLGFGESTDFCLPGIWGPRLDSNHEIINSHPSILLNMICVQMGSLQCKRGSGNLSATPRVLMEHSWADAHPSAPPNMNLVSNSGFCHFSLLVLNEVQRESPFGCSG